MARRNGVVAEFGQLHWVWKLLLVLGGFGLANNIVSSVSRSRCRADDPSA